MFNLEGIISRKIFLVAWCSLLCCLGLVVVRTRASSGGSIGIFMT